MTGKFIHHGPEWIAGGVRYHLWAPDATSVELMIGEDAYAMIRGESGEYSLDREDVPGTRYAFRIDKDLVVPDPASRFQPEDVHGPSELVASEYAWKHDWKGRPWTEATIYELHVGAFSPTGDYAGIEAKLDHLVDIGITAFQLMPINEYPGGRNWGYDGVLPYAPEASYGRPEHLKRLIDAAHGKGLMVFLDVVYNHFGPDGNYLNAYAKSFFTEKYHTPWGGAVNVEDRQEVRSFFIENALHWLEEYRFDGLRFDAVHAIEDASKKHFLNELAETIRARVGAERHVHLILENEHNNAALLKRENGMPIEFTAQWNDDFHHECHVLLTGETDSYYESYKDDTVGRLLRVLTQGFDYQGEVMPNLGRERGEASNHLPPGAFVNFLQNHDQIGNRAMGERLTLLADPERHKLFYALLLLSPFPPMLYMGEEWGETNPFLFFCDYHDELADAVRNGRRKEFSRFPAFSDPQKREKIPDPNAKKTFVDSKLGWDRQDAKWLALTRELTSLRHHRIVPLLASGWRRNDGERIGDSIIRATWHFEAGSLSCLLNLGNTSQKVSADGQTIHSVNATGDTVGPWGGVWKLEART